MFLYNWIKCKQWNCRNYDYRIFQQVFHILHLQCFFYIRNNFRSRISLENVAKAVDISPAYLSSIFPKETNMGYKEYLNTLRFEYAKKLLMYSDMSIGEICFESGFDDYANFMRSFKKRFDTSPALYRKELSKK